MSVGSVHVTDVGPVNVTITGTQPDYFALRFHRGLELWDEPTRRAAVEVAAIGRVRPVLRQLGRERVPRGGEIKKLSAKATQAKMDLHDLSEELRREG